jgi:hypothetical protein
MTKETDIDPEERERLRRAHECLMNGGGYHGKIYREQVRRVRELRQELKRLKDGK